MNIFPFKATIPRLNRIEDKTGFFKSVKEVYPSLKALNFFTDENKLAFYVYQISNGKRSMTGLLCSNDLRDFELNAIKKHEQTLLKKELLMLRLLEERAAMIKPVLVAYKAKKSIEKLLSNIIKRKKPLYKIAFLEDGEVHKLWKVDDNKTIKKIKSLFDKKVKSSYIADGHHRSTTTKMIYEGDTINSELNPPSILSAYFSFSQLKIYDYNRVVTLPPDVKLNVFLKKLSKHGAWLKNPIKKNVKYQLQVCASGKWNTFSWNKNIVDQFKKEKGTLLDVHLFNAIIVQKILNIQDIRETDYIEYVEGTKGKKGIKKLINDSELKVGFKLCPVRQQDLISIADAEQFMPPKSTYFEPRIKNGVIVQKF